MYKLYVSWSIEAAVIQSCCSCCQWLTELAMSPMWQSVTEQWLLLNLTRKLTGNLWHRKTQSTGFRFPELSFVFIILTSYIASHLRLLVHERLQCEQWGRVMQHADKRRQGVQCICPVWGRGTPFPPCPFTSSSFPPFYFSLSFIAMALPIFFFCPSLPYTRIVPLRFQAGGHRRRPNLVLVYFVCVICIP